MNSDKLLVNEIYLSLQGESTFAGLPCIFIRLTGCNLRCSYCDTAYAFSGGKTMDLDDVVRRINELSGSLVDTAEGRLPLIELTGGEPLLQKGSIPLMESLSKAGFTVLLETSGAHDIEGVPSSVRRIMDLKCPSSGEVDQNRFENLSLLRPIDELKFVIGTVEDYEWAVNLIQNQRLFMRCPILFSWINPVASNEGSDCLKPLPDGLTPLSRQALAEKIIEDALPVRFQLQMHKHIWASETRGV